MKKILLCLSIIAALGVTAAARAEWLTSVSTAMDHARAEHKAVMLDFTGSDWCGWCKKLKSEVFDQPEFATYADANLILVEVDFPRNKPQSPEQWAANQKLAETYNVHGYPSIVLLDGFGVQIGRSGYVPGGPKAFIESLERSPHYTPHPVAGTGPAVPRPTADLLPTASKFVMHYGNLTLKGISGSRDRRLALINNETLMTGETAKVKSHDQRVAVTVKEIREDSVLIIVDGKTAELKLGVPGAATVAMQH